ncbi:DotU family type IV/VI secretion system protein [Enterobacter hormaechei]|nr:DotU family type IV/VI secretion system protein [Enterobacter hormaechei]
MNDADIDLINKTFYPGWLMVSQLRSGQEVKDGEALYRRACRWVNAARESLNKAGFSTTSCEHMLYAYCALMDESVLNRDKQDDGYRQWRKDPLQARFFRTLNAGEELWERNRLRSDAESDGWHRRRYEVHFLQTGENPSPGYSGARRGEQQREGGIAGNGGANLPA